jgi:hypothetical protein
MTAVFRDCFLPPKDVHRQPFRACWKSVLKLVEGAAGVDEEGDDSSSGDHHRMPRNSLIRVRRRLTQGEPNTDDESLTP